MKNDRPPLHLDVKAAAQEGHLLEGADLLLGYERLEPLLHLPEASLSLFWKARWHVQTGANGAAQPWLDLSLQAALPLVCQRCMEPMVFTVDETHTYRFVATEEQALDEDDASDEDLLVLSRDFNLRELVEDELVMVLPLVPKHTQCTKEMHWSAADDGFQVETGSAKQPFANLQALMRTPVPKTGR